MLNPPSTNFTKSQGMWFKITLLWSQSLLRMQIYTTQVELSLTIFSRKFTCKCLKQSNYAAFFFLEKKQLRSRLLRQIWGLHVSSSLSKLLMYKYVIIYIYIYNFSLSAQIGNTELFLCCCKLGLLGKVS